jgi:uncharacterized membrane protein YqhA
MGIKMIENVFEGVLWGSRWAMLLAVIFSLILALGVLLVTTIDALNLLGQMLSYLDFSLTDEARSKMRLETIADVVGVIDGYLIASILIIFSLGIYELFLNKINKAEGSELASRLLLIRSLDDLKDRLANMILLILIVKFFQQALNAQYTNPIEVLYIAIGVLFVAGALYLSARAKTPKTAKSEEK